ncbi:tRNA lysidine(34) synthetase TilS [Bacteroidetes bacterium endosymbiont of Geopemphigus sp.]|uniref:tRNA lysidine(34) synthetase TilS n=1 Tax=Bacteroidetes bacterium endosymbiont of Geopemphigus sp. TaxID=2047937 RepID=UPI000CD0C8DD|nr:tRNA lysidine(34) synthetase TilS [Bacteroidetes bacterium endosymbiont of Geopemphigus sp.]
MKIKPSFFLDHLNEILPSHTKHVLVAVSGGMDSMVLLDLLQRTSLSLSVAHVNFQLRADEADADEVFVQNFCSYQKIPFYSRHFDTLNYVKIHKCSIQMGARALRYKWFADLLEELKLDYIALGHHLDDTLETFFINWIRGTGLKGLLGIPTYTKSFFRPLLPFTRGQLFEYAQSRNLQWREDPSNREDKYLRNVIRHRIVPLLSDLSPDLYKNFSTILLNLNDDYALSEQAVQSALKELTLSKKKTSFQLEIDLFKLRKLNPLKPYLFRLFSPYGFTNWHDLKRLLYAQSGKQLFSHSYRIVNDRNRWLLIQRRFDKKRTYEIHAPKIIKEPLPLSFTISSFRYKTALISIDFEKILFPLQLRTWRPGDYFYPLGMQQKKKLSKFFKDEKFSLLKKENTWLLVNADGAIIWIVNHRLDDRFKIRSTTHDILNINPL